MRPWDQTKQLGPCYLRPVGLDPQAAQLSCLDAIDHPKQPGEFLRIVGIQGDAVNQMQVVGQAQLQPHRVEHFGHHPGDRRRDGHPGGKHGGTGRSTRDTTGHRRIGLR